MNLSGLIASHSPFSGNLVHWAVAQSLNLAPAVMWYTPGYMEVKVPELLVSSVLECTKEFWYAAGKKEVDVPVILVP